MTLFAYLNGSDVGNKIRLRGTSGEGIAGLTASADGDGSQGGITFDDPTKSLTILGWQPVIVNETDCTAQPRLFTGYIGDRSTSRGINRTVNGRQIDATINDPNVLLNLRVIDGSDGKRGVETDNARITWLLGSYLSGLVYDTGWITSANPRSFEEADYRGQYAGDVLSSITEGKIFFAQWDPAASKVGLFYNNPETYTTTSSLTISNVLSDQLANPTTCFGPSIDAVLYQDPSQVYSKLRFVYTTGVLTTSNPITAATFFPSPLLTRGIQVEHSRIAKLTSATSWSSNFLNYRGQENAVVTTSVILPSTKVGLIDAGQRISVRFNHLDGFESFVYARVSSRTIRPVADNELFYQVDLTLNTHPIFAGRGGPSPGGFPLPPAGLPTTLAEKGGLGPAVVLDAGYVPPDGALILVVGTARIAGTPGVPAGFTDIHGNGTTSGVRACYRIASGEVASTSSPFGAAYGVDGGSSGNHYVWVFPAGTTIGQVVYRDTVASTTAVDCGGPITPAQNNVKIVGAAANDYFFSADPCTPDAGISEVRDASDPTGNPPTFWVATKDVATPVATSISGTLANAASWHGISIEVLGSATNNAPTPGQPVGPETVVMSGSLGTTAYPFANGSLQVFVDNVDQTAAISSYDGAAGTFRLLFIPTTTEVVRVYYQGR